MHAKNVEVRGCCMGIPFGCGSLLLLGIGVALWRFPVSAAALLGILAVVALAVLGAAVGLIALGCLDTKRPSPISLPR